MRVYFDSSALLKLYLDEEGRDQVRAELEAAVQAVVSGLACPEVRAALAAARRVGRIGGAELAAARAALEADWRGYVIVPVSAEVCRAAGEMAERFELRGADSVQLACYAELVRGLGLGEIRFCCFDGRLSAAATAWVAAERRRARS